MDMEAQKRSARTGAAEVPEDKVGELDEENEEEHAEPEPESVEKLVSCMRGDRRILFFLLVGILLSILLALRAQFVRVVVSKNTILNEKFADLQIHLDVPLFTTIGKELAILAECSSIFVSGSCDSISNGNIVLKNFNNEHIKMISFVDFVNTIGRAQIHKVSAILSEEEKEAEKEHKLCNRTWKESDNKQTSDLNCFKATTWDWSKREAVHALFAISANGHRAFKFSRTTFESRDECFEHPFENKHHTDFAIEHCDAYRPTVYGFYRWYFVRDDWTVDDRLESNNVHLSELDCSLAEIPLENGIFFTIHHGHRDNRLCPFDWESVNESKEVHGVALMIATLTWEFYWSLRLHVFLIFIPLIACYCMLYRFRSGLLSYGDIETCWEGKVIGCFLFVFISYLPMHMYLFMNEPLLDSYVLSSYGDRLDGAWLNATILTSIPLKILLYFFPIKRLMSVETKIFIYRALVYISVPLSLTLTAVIGSDKFHSKYSFDAIVFILLGSNGIPLMWEQFVHRNISKEEWNARFALNSISALCLEFGWFLCVIFGGISNYIPPFAPSVVWWKCVVLGMFVVVLHCRYLHPFKMPLVKIVTQKFNYSMDARDCHHEYNYDC